VEQALSPFLIRIIFGFIYEVFREINTIQERFLNIFETSLGGKYILRLLYRLDL
jgi:hypothetical protein